MWNRIKSFPYVEKYGAYILSGFKCSKPIMSDSQKSCDTRFSRLESPLFIRQWAGFIEVADDNFMNVSL